MKNKNHHVFWLQFLILDLNSRASQLLAVQLMLSQKTKNDGSGNCGNEAEVLEEIYLKEPVLWHSDPLEYWQSKKAISGPSGHA